MLPVFTELLTEGAVPAGDAEAADRLGAMGAHGIDGLGQQALSLAGLLPVDQAYDWSTLGAISCLNVDGGNVINQGSFPVGAHNDFDHAEIFHLALAMSLRQPLAVSP
jgi:hypothetical protein